MTADFADFHRRLHQWYRRHGRQDLPWRNTDDPYTIYVSEILLQQTQVKTVLERFYYPFLKKFPTLEALAVADEQAVLKAWQGLGYYNRALNLHRAAKRTAPRLPEDYEGLMALPGIGRNTAHAILAFAYHQPVPVLEANVKRVVHRIFGLREAKPAALWQYARSLVDDRQPFHYNQAMMDLGAMVCTPTMPACAVCPANAICQGRRAPHDYPTPKQAKRVPVRHKRIIILYDAQGRVYLTPRRSRFLNGLYGFVEEACAQDAPAAGKLERLGEVSQTYSHFRLEAEIIAERAPSVPPAEGRGGWFTPDEAEQLPLSRADEKVLRLWRRQAGRLLPSSATTGAESNSQPAPMQASRS